MLVWMYTTVFHYGDIEGLSHIYCLNRIIDNIEVICGRTVNKCGGLFGEVAQEFMGARCRNFIRNVLQHMCALVRVVFTDIF